MACKYEGKGAHVGRCMGTKEIDPCSGYDKCKQYEPDYMTYADLIRSMNDEELAEYIIDVIIEAYEHVNIPVDNRCEAIRDYLKALKQPVEGTE